MKKEKKQSIHKGFSFAKIFFFRRIEKLFSFPSSFMCGIIGIVKSDGNAVYDAYNGLSMLQHRGQDSAGIVTHSQHKFYEKRGFGLVRNVFDEYDIHTRLKGRFALGHCRYTTAGNSDNIEEAQPFFVNAPLGMYLVHNGNLTNTEALKEKVIQNYNRYLHTDSDTEILINVFADQMYKELKEEKEDLQKVVFSATKKTMQRISGAYSIITIIDRVGMLVFRDPNGIRPLVMAKKETTHGTEWAFASEDIALKALDYEIVRDVHPGEAILITPKGKKIEKQCIPGQLHPCIFEYVYLARPDSMINDISVHKTRLRLGGYLAKQIQEADIHIDSVMPVPDSGRIVALQVAQKLGIKYREGLVRNKYVGRTFIMPNQQERKKSIKQKLNAIELEFRNRNILLVDDSIVRGNTIKQIIQLCRKVGAKKVFVASGAPPVRYPDVYGIDIPTRRELIAHNLSTEEIRKLIDADGLFYQNIEDLVEACSIGNPDIKEFHTSCFSGKYITPDVTKEFLEKTEEKRIMSLQAEKQNLSLPTV